MRTTLKLMSNPKRLFANRRCVNSGFLCTGAVASTDLISTITLSSALLHNQVRPESHLNPRALVDDGNRLLANRAQSSLLQLVCQDHFIDGFQQARPEAGMNAVGRVHDLLRHVVFRHVKSKTISRKDAKLAKKTPPGWENPR